MRYILRHGLVVEIIKANQKYSNAHGDKSKLEDVYMDLQRNTEVSKSLFNKLKYKYTSGSIQQIAIGILLFLIIYSFIASSITPQKYNLFEGDIATVDIKAPKNGINDYATQKLIDEAVKSVEKVYTIDQSVQSETVKNINTFFAKVLEIKSLQNVDEKVKAERLKSESTITLAEDDYFSAIKASTDDLKSLQKSVVDILVNIYSQRINTDQKDLKSKKDDFSYSIRNNLKFNKELRELGTNIGFALIKPNMVYNSKATEEKFNEVKNSIKPIKIKKDQKIISKGEVVTEEGISILKNLGLLEQQKKIDFLLYLGIAIIVALFEGLIIVYLYRFCPEILKISSKLILLSLIIIIELLAAKFAYVYNFSGFLIPTAFASMLVSILIDPRLAVVLNIALSVFITLMTGFNFDILIVALIGGSAGAIVVSRMHQRNDLITAGLLVSAVNGLSILGIGLINNTELITVLMQSILGILNGVLSSTFTLGLLPFCETIFNIVTPIKLLELSNPNHPLLKRLLFETPGTYHHSIVVGNLAEAATDAIGGNSLLARVGSYYHDIGKIKRPYFFRENQITNDNPHDKITPSVSALIITSHVKDGLDMAKKNKIPDVIREFIEQHHGTTLVKYFYVKAVNDSDSQGEVIEAQYRYEGPKPKTKETAVVFLADSVEAAVRSISLPTKSKMEDMVRKIVKDKLEDNQLDECDLTLKDINRLTTAFINVLNGIYHQRIDYPDFTTSAKDGGEK